MLVLRVRAPILAGLLCFVASAFAEMTAEDLAAQWSAQRSDIVTAQFKCKYLVNAGQYLRKLSQDDVLQVLSSAGLESGVLDLNRVGRQLFVEPLPGNQYADEEVWFDDGKLRVLELWDGVRETDMVRRPEGDAFYLARSNQVSLYRENESSVAMRDLSEFRLLPEIDPAKSSLKSLPGGTLLVACGDQRIVVDGALRFPVDCTWMDRQGHVVKRVLQRNLTEISGIVLPLLTVTRTSSSTQS